MTRASHFDAYATPWTGLRVTFRSPSDQSAGNTRLDWIGDTPDTRTTAQHTDARSLPLCAQPRRTNLGHSAAHNADAFRDLRKPTRFAMMRRGPAPKI
jgi:hypothetical protein